MIKKSVGFTGTQQGMTKNQKKVFRKIIQKFLDENKIEKFRHGDCLGADEDAHRVIKEISLGINIYIHPPIISTKRAFCKDYFYIHEKKQYLDRNHDIVNNSDILIATPKEHEQQLRSGTWATIRYAKKIGKPTVIILTRGELEIFTASIDNAENVARLFKA